MTSWGALESALGPGSIARHDPVEVDGCDFDASFEPADGDALARGLALFGEHERSVVVRGGGSRLGLGNPPQGASLLLSTRHFCGIDTFEVEDGVVHAGAGTPLDTIRAEVAEHGWELAIDGAAPEATLGGVLASGAIGPRVTGFGPPRDALLGLEVALASGERTRCGGRVVKNVTGYDLGKLYTGSLGCLGVIEGAWLRLRPLAESVVVLTAPSEESAAFVFSAVAAARRSTTRVAALLDVSSARAAGVGDAACLVLELAGEAAATEEDAAWLAREVGAAPRDDAGLVDRVAAWQRDSPGPLGVRVRIASLPSTVGRVANALGAAGFAVVSHPGAGLTYGRVEAASDAALDASLAAAIEASEVDPAAALRFEALPVRAKNDRDVFGATPAAIAIASELKRRFDPKSVLNPGRSAGRI